MCNTGCDTTKKLVLHYPVILSRVFASCHINFAEERRLSTGLQQLLMGRGEPSMDQPSVEDRMWERNLVNFLSIKKTNQTDLGTFSSQLVEDMMRLMSPTTPQMMRKMRTVPRTQSQQMHF
ncbi:hypothetical protein M9H77_23184 [Catharanthus roseus]|uniref:Uncharacterized protein n=1 Tax=Catharanthus roseus TaxID=4058 RepID=A0ACC0ATA9_CATRO|nr:hypothetical protein M9H77_23184 [Catharanthus roseus]